MKSYHEHIDKTIIEILYENEKLSSGELKKQLDQSLLNHDYKKTAPDTYWGRLRQLTSSYKNKQSKYVIQPVLARYEEIQEGNIRGAHVFYGLTKTARIRHTLQLPILKSESKIEQAYRLLFYYIVFFYNHTIKLKDDNKYNAFLEKLHIDKNELKFLGTSVYKEFKITKWTHPESEIEFTRKDFLHPSGKEGLYEYFCMLPGFSPSEFQKINESSLLPYQQLNFIEDEVKQYCELLENQKLIKKSKLKELVYLDKEIYTIVNNSLRELLADCWTLQSFVSTYLEYIWKDICKPTNEERIWYEHLWGKTRSNQWFIECDNRRRGYKKENNNQILKETQESINFEKIQIIKKFESIKNKYVKTINAYSYFIKPLLNVVYPLFLRKEFR